MQPATNFEQQIELTPLQEDALAAICAGLTDAEMAEVLHRSPRTAKHYRSSLREIFNAKNTAQLVSIAWSTGAANPHKVKHLISISLLSLVALVCPIYSGPMLDMHNDMHRAPRVSRSTRREADLDA